MGLWRVFSRSIRFTFRTRRRFFGFLLAIAIISTLIAFYIDNIDDLRTDNLLAHKGVRVEKTEAEDIPYSQAHSLYEDTLAFAENSQETSIDKSAEFYYADLSSSLEIQNLFLENPWMADFANPSHIQSGSYPDNPNEILIPEGASETQQIVTPQGNVTLETQLAVGQNLIIRGLNGETIELTIAGTITTTQYQRSNPSNQLRLFMDQSKFLDVLNAFGMEIQDTKGYMLAFTVEGYILQTETHQKVDRLNDELKSLIQDEGKYGNWRDQPNSLPTQDTIGDSQEILVQLGFVIIGGVFLSVIFAYLISRFRRREIAILKAMGYSHTSVRTSLVAEILTISFIGFIVGLGSAHGLLLYLNDFEWEPDLLIRPQAIGVSFLIMVVISLPGMWFVSRRVLGVSPAEAFREK